MGADINANGTMVFGNGLGGSTSLVMTNDTVGDHVVTVPKRTMTIAGEDKIIGVNQTWQDVTASRASGTTYTNSTGKPIQIFISGYNSGSALMTFTVASVVVGKYVYTVNSDRSLSFIVPNGATYLLTSTGFSMAIWSELR